MYNHINRFKDDDRVFLREQMSQFFGMTDTEIPSGLSEVELLSLYREQLRRVCGLEHVANLRVPHRTKNRTWFHLVVGGHHRAVLKLFREVERKVCGEETTAIRTSISVARTEQPELFGREDSVFEAMRRQDRAPRAKS